MLLVRNGGETGRRLSRVYSSPKQATPRPDPGQDSRMRRLLPVVIVLIVIAALWYSGVAERLNWAELGRQQDALRGWVDANPVLAGALYLVLYAAIVALSMPQAVVVTIAGGLLFGTLVGGILAILGATTGAIILFLIARSALGDSLARKGGTFLRTVRDGLERDGFNYLLAIRLIPAFPFWLVNLAAALGGMRLAPYAAATLLGIAPATFVFASIGAGIGSILAAGGRPDLSVVLSPTILGPLIGLAALSLLPIAWRRWRKPDG